jgi:hypothetical protein
MVASQRMLEMIFRTPFAMFFPGGVAQIIPKSAGGILTLFRPPCSTGSSSRPRASQVWSQTDMLPVVPFILKMYLLFVVVVPW